MLKSHGYLSTIPDHIGTQPFTEKCQWYCCLLQYNKSILCHFGKWAVLSISSHCFLILQLGHASLFRLFGLVVFPLYFFMNNYKGTIQYLCSSDFQLMCLCTKFLCTWVVLHFYMTGRKHHLLIDLASYFYLLILSVLSVETENNLRGNAPETFDHRWVGCSLICQLEIIGKLMVLTEWCILGRDALIASVPSYEEPYIKVPRVLSMD